MKATINQFSGQFFKNLRVQRFGNDKQSYVAAKVKIDVTKLCRIENGEQFPNPKPLLLLCRFYDTSASTFWRLIEDGI